MLERICCRICNKTTAKNGGHSSCKGTSIKSSYIGHIYYTSWRSLFSTALLLRLEVEADASAVETAALFRGDLLCGSTPDSVDLLNMDGTAPGFNRLLFFIPNDEARTESTSNESSVKCSLQRKLFSVAFHCARVLCTCFSHWALRTRSFGNLNTLTRSEGVLEQPAATHRFTILLILVERSELAALRSTFSHLARTL